MKNHVCLNTTRISDWLKQVASRKNTQMRLSHNRRRCQDGVSIDTARINIHLALYINISIFLIKTASFIDCICESLQAAVDVSFGSEGVMKKMDTPIFTANINNNKNHLGGEIQNNTLCKPPRGGQRDGRMWKDSDQK